jgi:Holliday junction resolvase|tara:strand:- start:236 stop:619 length:384 start_codon:yes stop_codon:yes gene_type:complete
MSTKSKGSNAERELIHKFWANGFAAIRSAGSGSMKYPSPDILAAKNGRVLAIECKITKKQNKYFERKEIEDLLKFSKIFNAEPLIAVKFKGFDWFFLRVGNLKETKKLFVIDVKLAENKGKSFENIL